MKPTTKAAIVSVILVAGAACIGRVAMADDRVPAVIQAEKSAQQDQHRIVELQPYVDEYDLKNADFEKQQKRLAEYEYTFDIKADKAIRNLK